jgi:teichoic acid transport system ATP-binding protein
VAEPTVSTDATTQREDTSSDGPPETTIVVDDAHVSYRLLEDRKQGLRHVVANRLKSRPTSSVHAVRGVSLTAHRGEAIGIIGSNGSGKSTLMRALAGVLPVTSGAVYARSQPMLLGVGSVLKPNLSGRRNILLGCLALGLRRAEIDHLMDDIVAFSGLGAAIDRPLRTYSSGMRARLQFSISTSVEPEILLVDEALAVGDREFKGRSYARIERLREQAGTVFIVSHSLSEIRRVCTRTIWLADGRVVLDDDPRTVIRAYKAALPD